MSYIFNEEDYNLACQPVIHLYVKIEMYNLKKELVHIITGLVNNGSCSINSNSKVRRTFSATLLPIDEVSIEIASNNTLWIDKTLKLFVGMKTPNGKDIKWYSQGVYSVTNSSITYNATNNQLQISCSDKMVDLDGTINGEIGGALSLSIPAYNVLFKESWIKTYGSFNTAYIDNHGSDELMSHSDIKALIQSYFETKTYTKSNDDFIVELQELVDKYGKYYVVQWGVSNDDVILLGYNIIRSTIKQLLKQFTNIGSDYVIDEIGEYKGTDKYENYLQYRKEHPIWNCIPYDEEYSTGTSISQILEELCTLYANYDYAFDEDGVLQIRMIPTLYDDDVILSHKQIADILVANDTESTSTDLTKVRNVCEIWGENFETDYYSENCSYNDSNNAYYATLNDSTYTEYSNGDIFSLKISTENIAGTCLCINNISKLPIYRESDEKLIDAGDLIAGYVYSFKYSKSYVNSKYVEKFYLLGQYQVHALCALTDGTTIKDGYSTYRNNVLVTCDLYSEQYYKYKYNCDTVKLVVIPDSPYTVQAIGERFKSYSGDIYENIQSDSDALDRANYELWKNCRLTDSITIKTSLIPWLNEYQKLAYKKSNSDEVVQYVTLNVTHNYDDCTTTIEMYTFYPLYDY